MQILSKNLKQGEIKVKIENIDDLWYLYHIINTGDLIKGQTFRKIQINNKEEEKSKSTKKKVFMEIEVKKIEFQESVLKLLGIIIHGPDDVKKGAYHSFNLIENEIITITKPKWYSYQLEKLNDAAEAKHSILLCILDREEAIFALSKPKGYQILTSLSGEVEKKAMEVKNTKNFYSELIGLIEEYSKRYEVDNIILASPAFWKEELYKEIKDKQLKQKIVLATCNSVSDNAINEVLRRPELKQVLKKIRFAKELELVEDLLIEIAKKANASYGIEETDTAAQAGAVKTLMVTDNLLRTYRDQEKYQIIDKIMAEVDKTKGEVFIISSEHEGGKKLDSLGGIAAILRYKI